MEQILLGSRDMASMQRFVIYIYAYENGEKTHNTGYAKIEIRGSGGRLEIHLAGIGTQRRKAEVRFLYKEGERLRSVSIGEIQLENGGGQGQFTFLTNAIGDAGRSFDEMVGIELKDLNNQTYMSFWKELPSLKENRMPGEGVETSAVKPDKEILEEAEQESLHSMELPIRNVFPEHIMEDIWNGFKKNRNGMKLNEEVYALQIDLNDLREFPQKYWGLGNNSFLLHGFFNYHYLLFGKQADGKWFLGIPGIYERQEGLMASVFGFSGFMQLSEPAESKDAMQPDVKHWESRQGVWYHILED